MQPKMQTTNNEKTILYLKFLNLVEDNFRITKNVTEKWLKEYEHTTFGHGTAN